MSTNNQAGRAPRIQKLQLNKETVHDLSASETDGVKGGQRPNSVRNSCAGICHIITGKCYGK